MRWRLSVDNQTDSSPAIGPDGTIYIGSYSGYLYAVEDNGTLKWKFKAGDWVVSSPAIGSDGTIYVGSDDGYLYAINSNGKLVWKFKTGGWIISSPTISTNGTIYIGSCDGYVYAIKSSSHGRINSPWPMFHHDLMHSGYPGIRIIKYTEGRIIRVMARNSTIDNATASTSFVNFKNKPKNINLNVNIRIHLKLPKKVHSTTIQISGIPTTAGMVFYKYVNGVWINLDNESSCGNCGFKKVYDNTTNTTTIFFTITDGGILDADNKTNGQIQDPVIVANTVTTRTSSGGGGGCTVSNSPSIGLLLILITMIGFGIRRKFRER